MMNQKTSDRERSGSRVRDFWERIYIGSVIGLMVIALVIFMILVYVWYDFLVTRPPAVARVWAIVASIVAPFLAVMGFVIGIRLAVYRLQWHEQDTNRVLDKIAGALFQAGIQASDVRVYGFRQIWRRENQASQEIDLFDMPALEDGQQRDQREIVEV